MGKQGKRFVAIVLSAGTGSRMKSDVPKQYMNLRGFPVVYYSLKAFQDSGVDAVVLVAGKDDVEYCRTEIVEKYRLDKVCKVIPGGVQRYDSVYEGLKAIDDADYVLIHDGARPLLDQRIIETSMNAVEEYKACVAGMPVKDTIKVSDEKGYAVSTPARDTLWTVQTPQSFSYGLVKEAYDYVYRAMKEGKEIPLITDDAMVVEYAADVKVKLIPGSYENIKITTPEDLKAADVFLGA